jgi:hypothetical protein
MLFNPLLGIFGGPRKKEAGTVIPVVEAKKKRKHRRSETNTPAPTGRLTFFGEGSTTKPGVSVLDTVATRPQKSTKGRQ